VVPVTPGTKVVTVGGLIAADVHGKNHHGAGSFCEHVLSLDLALADGSIVTCAKERNGELFAATCGGMGLTGVILRATVKMVAVETSRIRLRTVRAANLSDAISVFESEQDVTYSVAWINCLAQGHDLGRSIVFLGEHARADELPAADRAKPLARTHRNPKAVLVDFPAFVLSRPAVRLFNALYFHRHRAGTMLLDLDPYFYPLDAIHDWNRMYGRHGFVQYQPVLPLAESREGLRRLLAEVAKAGQASFLAVLKRMGSQSFGMLSFPLRGYTLTLDFPATARNLALLDRLDHIVREHGGRVYLAKDARTSPAMIEAGYPRLGKFRDVRRRFALAERFASQQSRRLEL
jgi:FAD/FMN-containing dehydrogenase